MQYIYLILAILSSLSIAVMLRIFEHRGADRLIIVASNYIPAAILAYFFSNKVSVEPAVFYFGAVLGLFFFMAFAVFSRAIKDEGIASAVTIGRLSLALPVIISILLWGEKPMLVDIISLLLIFIIILTWEDRIGRVSTVLLLLFILFGSLDTAIKFFKMRFPATDDSFFLIVTFGSAVVWSWFYVLIVRSSVSLRDVGWGFILGVPNYFGFFFRLKALETVPAYITFPFINTGLIILSALVGHQFFKERLTRKKVILILLGIAAVFFLAG